MNIKDRLQSCIEKSGSEITSDGGFENLDSIKFINAIVSIESEFAIEYPDEFLSINAFSNINNIYTIIKNSINN